MAGHCRSTQRIARCVPVLSLMLSLLHSAPAFAQTRVACVGDSITYGYGLSNREAEAYPFVLQDLLGSEFEVGNFGDSGSTLQESGDKPWRAQAVYSQCLEFTPNIVVIMLGTNDAKPANWSEAGFVSDYQALIAEFRDQGAEVYVATPPAVIPPGAFEIQPEVVNDEVVPLVRQVASAADAPLIDVYLAFEDQPDLLPDTVHPNAAGARLIAERVRDALLAVDESTSSLQTSAASTTLTSGSGGTSASALTTTTTTTTTTQGAGGQVDPSATTVTSVTSVTGQGGTTDTTGQAATDAGAAQGASETTGLAASTNAGPTATSAASGGTAGGGEGLAEQHSADEPGCSCGVPAAGSSTRSTWLLLVLGLLVSRRRPR